MDKADICEGELYMNMQLPFVNETYEYLYMKGSHFISDLQQSLHEETGVPLFTWVTKGADPWLAFTVWIPLIAGLSWKTGARLMLAFVTNEWLNQISKNLLHGDRPYWWVHESQTYPHETSLKQFPLTCETGPGNPSGHCMMAASIWYITIWSFIHLHLMPSGSVSLEKKEKIAKGLWCTYATYLIVVCLARMYFATHFPHQCIIGIVIGYLIGCAICMTDLPSETITLATLLGIMYSTVSVYSMEEFVWKADHMWSVKMAQKWCINRSYLHLETTPNYAIVRYTSAALGLALVLATRQSQQLNEAGLPPGSGDKIAGVICSCLSSAVIYFFRLSLPHTSVPTYYALEFVIHLLLPIVILFLVPMLVMIMSRSNRGRRN